MAICALKRQASDQIDVLITQTLTTPPSCNGLKLSQRPIRLLRHRPYAAIAESVTVYTRCTLSQALGAIVI